MDEKPNKVNLRPIRTVEGIGSNLREEVGSPLKFHSLSPKPLRQSRS